MKLNKIRTSKESYLFTGGAGTGKSTLLLLLALGFKNDGKKIQIISPTGLAAQNVGGRTLHSVLGINFRLSYTENLKKLAKEINHYEKRNLDLDVLIIDEISMITIPNFKLLDFAMKRANGNDLPFGGVRVIMFGDFLQLPPINKDEDQASLDEISNEFIFETMLWQELNPQVVLLKEIKRVDEEQSEWKEILKQIRQVKDLKQIEKELQKFSITNKDSEILKRNTDLLAIYTKNIDVENHNNIAISQLPGETTIVNFLRSDLLTNDEINKIIIENEALNFAKELNLKKGAKIIFTSSDRKHKKYNNGTRGIIKKINFGKNNIITNLEIEKEDGAELKLFRTKYGSKDFQNKYIYQFPIRLAYAFTVNKAQGQTIKNDLLISINPESDSDSTWNVDGKLYTALSRVKNPDQINLVNFTIDSLSQSNKALMFYDDFESAGNFVTLEEYDFENEVNLLGQNVVKDSEGNINFDETYNKIKNELKISNTTFETKEEKIINSINRNNSSLKELSEYSEYIKYEEIYDFEKGDKLICFPKEKVIKVDGIDSAVFYKQDTGEKIPSVSFMSDKLHPDDFDNSLYNEVYQLAWSVEASKAKSYGNAIDDNKYLLAKEGKVEEEHANILIENLIKIKNCGLKIVAVNLPVAHNAATISGEIDQILYHEDSDTYFVSDTKTGKKDPSESEKYQWQINMYIDILKSNNPNLKISNIAIIDWVRDIKKEKILNLGKSRDFNNGTEKFIEKYGDDVLLNANKIEERIFVDYERGNKFNALEPQYKTYRDSLILSAPKNIMIPDFGSFPPYTEEEIDYVLNTEYVEDEYKAFKKTIEQIKTKKIVGCTVSESIDFREGMNLEDNFNQKLEKFNKI